MTPDKIPYLDLEILLIVVFCSCACSRLATEDEITKVDSAVRSTGSAIKSVRAKVKGLVITPSPSSSEDNGETREYVRPVLPDFVSGGLSQRVIAAEISSHVAEIRECYQTGLRHHKQKISGDVTLSAEIGADGSVISAEVRESSLRHPQTEQCVTGRMRIWSFPKPQTGSNVRILYTFTFLPE